MYDAKPNRGTPDLASKLVDWRALAGAGGEDLIYGKRVLDLGGSYGLDAYMFAHKTTRVLDLRDPRFICAVGSYTMIDIEPHSVDWIRAHCPETTCVLGDIHDLPFKDESFDTVLDFSTLDNITDPMRGYDEAVRVLAPGGTLLTTFANALLLAPSEGSTPMHPGWLHERLLAAGLVKRWTGFWHYERAGIAVVKP
jgi:ubiquinone/menaquinone biosynthesis C-methylase UbiE